MSLGHFFAGAIGAFLILWAIGAFLLNVQEHEENENDYEGRNG